MPKFPPYVEELLRKRYLKTDKNWKELARRVASFLAGNNPISKEWYFEAINELKILPNTPCLINASNDKPSQCAACFVLPIEDSITSIFQTLGYAAKIHQRGGGTGINFSPLRPRGFPVSGATGISSGPISFMKVFDTATQQMKQGGIRKGANIGILDIFHPSIIEFIRCKEKDGVLSNFNISVSVPDKFLQWLETSPNEEHVTLFGEDFYLLAYPSGEPVPVDQATKTDQYFTNKQVWDLLCHNAWLRGEPGVIFIDEVNRNLRKPVVAVNPCQPKDAPLLDGDRLRKISEQGDTWESWETGIREVLLLKCNNGMKIRCTPEHKLMLEDGTFIEAQSCLDQPLKWSTATRKVQHLDKHDILRGFLFGDGSLCGGGFGVSVQLDRNREPKVAELLESFGHFHQQDSGSFYANLQDLKDTLSIDLSFLKQKLPVRLLPEDILYGKTNKVAGFLCGLFSANGSCNLHGQISLKATCLPMIEDVQLLLSSFGIPSWISVNKPSEIEWPNGIYTSKESYNLQIAPRNAHLFMERVGGFLQQYKNANIRMSDKPYNTKLKVVSISSLGKQEVWDYRMKKPPAYNFCQGAILSNCGEQPLGPFEACCLASINLAHPSLINEEKRSFETEKLSTLVKTSVDMLNDMLDRSSYPLPQIDKAVHESRKIGLGVMGWADLLLKLHVRYGSPESLAIARDIGLLIKHVADRHSKECGYHNEVLISQAPTGSRSLIAQCSPGIEPNIHWVTEHRREGLEPVVVTHPLAAKYLDEGKDLPDYFVVAKDIPIEEHIAMQAAWQENTDAAVSKTILLPAEANEDSVKDAYMMAWKSKCKGITVYREGSRSKQVMTEAGKDKEPVADTKPDENPFDFQRPKVLDGKVYKLKLDVGNKVESVYLIVGLKDGRPYEIFVQGNIRELDQIIANYIDTTTRLVSLSMRGGLPLSKIIQQLSKVPETSLYSLPVKIANVLKQFLPAEENKCPECNGILELVEGCMKCPSCGWSKCE